jgi:HSP20 family protein
MLLANPFEALHDFQQALESYYDSDWLAATPSGSGPFPPINVFRKGEDFVIIAEVPGVKKFDIRVQVKDSTIRISGNKTVDYAENAGVHRRERLSGKFDRVVSIPVQIDADRMQAECRDGILALLVPRAERDKPKVIKVA